MSASERLKALDEAMTDAPWELTIPNEAYTTHGELTVADETSLIAIRNALPQIVAVVEAAEQGRDHSLLLSSEPAGVAMLGWRVSDAQALQSALAALDEALTTKGER